MVKGHAGALSRRECESKETLMGLLERFSDEESCEGRLIEEKVSGGFVCPV
ncbi:hypothetical protein [Atopobium sp. oral taxon 416]|nr:hypothetical protein [Atopobium sp. oral taxon 416]QUC04017.1 hypothetical protein J4859_03485 [Atopobium sp. oral taxon 416]